MADPAINAVPLKAVQVDALVVMKLIKHCSQTFPTVATGSLVGMDVDGILEVTNCFQFAAVETPATDGYDSSAASSNQTASAPRAKANVAYQSEMIKLLREVNVDSANVGWYTSANMGNFVNINMIENQFFYQKDLNERTVALVHDVSRSTMGALSLKAFRLSPTFMAAYKEGKFTTESLQKSNLSYRDIVIELPIIVRNSSMLNAFLHQLPVDASDEPLTMPNSLSEFALSDATFPPLDPNRDALDLSIDPFLEKTCDLLLDSIETHNSEINNQQYHQRQLTREQAKITAWQQKRKTENAARVAAKQTPLPEDEWTRLFKLPQEPSRLESLLNSRQIEQYSRQVDGFTASVTAKMFAVKGNLLPGDARQ